MGQAKHNPRADLFSRTFSPEIVAMGNEIFDDGMVWDDKSQELTQDPCINMSCLITSFSDVENPSEPSHIEAFQAFTCGVYFFGNRIDLPTWLSRLNELNDQNSALDAQQLSDLGYYITTLSIKLDEAENA
jgi:hypothetical protein